MRHNSCILDMQVGAEPVGGLQLMQDSFCWRAAKAAILNLQGRTASLYQAECLQLSCCAHHCLLLEQHEMFVKVCRGITTTCIVGCTIVLRPYVLRMRDIAVCGWIVVRNSRLQKLTVAD